MYWCLEVRKSGSVKIFQTHPDGIPDDRNLLLRVLTITRKEALVKLFALAMTDDVKEFTGPAVEDTFNDDKPERW